MPEVEVEFRHTVEVWTVGDLRKALADITDDTKLIFSPVEGPGSDLSGPEQVAFSAGVSEFYNSHTRETYPAFEVSLEFPPGTYYRRAWKDGDERRAPDGASTTYPGEHARIARS